MRLQRRRIERTEGEIEVLAPAGWPSAQVDAWLDWSADLPTDYPVADPPRDSRPAAPYDGLLGGGPDRYARRLAAWGLAIGHFDTPAEAEAFAARLVELQAAGVLAFG